MTKLSVRFILIVVLVTLLAVSMTACGGSGNGVEKAVSGAVSDGIDNATGNVEQMSQPGICYDRSGIVAIEVPCQ